MKIDYIARSLGTLQMQALLFNHPDEDICKMHWASLQVCSDTKEMLRAQQEPQPHLAIGVGAHLRPRATTTEHVQFMYGNRSRKVSPWCSHKDNIWSWLQLLIFPILCWCSNVHPSFLCWITAHKSQLCFSFITEAMLSFFILEEIIHVIPENIHIIKCSINKY